MEKRLIKIAIPGTPRMLFTYLLPYKYGGLLSPGQRLIVPLGHRQTVGFYIEPTRKRPTSKLKSILDILDNESPFNPKLFDFMKWMAEYYYANPADVFNAALPPDLRKIRKSAFLNNDRIPVMYALDIELPKMQFAIAKR